MKAATASSMRAFDSSRKTRDYHVPGSWVSDDAAFQQDDFQHNYLRTRRACRTYDDNKPSVLLYIIILALLIELSYRALGSSITVELYNLSLTLRRALSFSIAVLNFILSLSYRAFC
jgi:hypothetical protein